MAFNKLTHTDRVVQFPGRRTITNTSTLVAETVDVVRAEGTVSNAGDAFNAATLNSLETRVDDQFAIVDTGLVGIKETVAWTNPNPTAQFSAQTVTLSTAITGYSYYSIISKSSYTGTTNGDYANTGKIPINGSTWLLNAGVVSRGVQAPSGSSIAIANDSSGGSNYSIPIKIFLHK